ncbi:MAG: HlyD family secretion protein [Vulcanimicrobiota bacterium]
MSEKITKKKQRKKLRNKIILWTIVAIVVFFVARGIISSQKAKKLTYETESLIKGSITSMVSSTGTLSPVSTVDVGSQVSGIIQEIYYDYNDRVKKGDVLARIDPELYETQLEQAQARMKSRQSDMEVSQVDYEKAQIAISQADADVYQARAGYSQAEADLQNIKANYIQAQANLKKSLVQLENDHDEYLRADKLYKKELISLSEQQKAYTVYMVSNASVDSARAGVKSASASVKAAESRLESARAALNASKMRRKASVASLKAAESRLKAARASIQQAQGDIETVNVNLRRSIIISPVNGIVIDKKVEPGQTVAASFQAPVLFQLAENLNRMEVVAAVDEADIGRVNENQEVTFTVDAFPDDKFEGKIQQVRASPKVEQNIVTYEVIILTDNDDLKLKPGMTANIEIKVETKEDILKLPNAALRFKPQAIPGFPLPERDVKDKVKKKDKDETGDKKARNEEKKEKTDKEKPGEEEKKDKAPPIDYSTVWALVNKKPVAYQVQVGISDNLFSEIISSKLKKVPGNGKKEKKVDKNVPPSQLEKGMEVITDAMTQKQKKEREKNRRRRIRIF